MSADPTSSADADAPAHGSSAFEARAAFLLRLRERGVRDLTVLRAMEAVSRADFVDPAHAHLAARDVALPIACGQTVPEPLFVARLLAGSLLGTNMRVLVIGLGSGYLTALLAHLVREIVAIERFQSLLKAAEARMAALGLTNVSMQRADVSQPIDAGRFDRVVVAAATTALPAWLWACVADGGAIVHGRALASEPGHRPKQVLVREQRTADGLRRETVICPSRLPPLQPGLPRRL